MPLLEPQVAAILRKAEKTNKNVVRSLVVKHPVYQANAAVFRQGVETKNVKKERWYEIAIELGIDLKQIGKLKRKTEGFSDDDFSTSKAPGRKLNTDSILESRVAYNASEVSDDSLENCPKRSKRSNSFCSNTGSEAGGSRLSEIELNELEGEKCQGAACPGRGRRVVAASGREQRAKTQARLWNMADTRAGPAPASAAGRERRTTAGLKYMDARKRLRKTISSHPHFKANRHVFLGRDKRLGSIPKAGLLHIAKRLGISLTSFSAYVFAKPPEAVAVAHSKQPGSGPGAGLGGFKSAADSRPRSASASQTPHMSLASVKSEHHDDESEIEDLIIDTDVEGDDVRCDDAESLASCTRQRDAASPVTARPLLLDLIGAGGGPAPLSTANSCRTYDTTQDGDDCRVLHAHLEKERKDHKAALGRIVELEEQTERLRAKLAAGDGIVRQERRREVASPTMEALSKARRWVRAWSAGSTTRSRSASPASTGPAEADGDGDGNGNSDDGTDLSPEQVRGLLDEVQRLTAASSIMTLANASKAATSRVSPTADLHRDHELTTARRTIADLRCQVDFLRARLEEQTGRQGGKQLGAGEGDDDAVGVVRDGAADGDGPSLVPVTPEERPVCFSRRDPCDGTTPTTGGSASARTVLHFSTPVSGRGAPARSYPTSPSASAIAASPPLEHDALKELSRPDHMRAHQSAVKNESGSLQLPVSRSCRASSWSGSHPAPCSPTYAMPPQPPPRAMAHACEAALGPKSPGSATPHDGPMPMPSAVAMSMLGPCRAGSSSATARRLSARPYDAPLSVVEGMAPRGAVGGSELGTWSGESWRHLLSSQELSGHAQRQASRDAAIAPQTVHSTATEPIAMTRVRGPSHAQAHAHGAMMHAIAIPTKPGAKRRTGERLGAGGSSQRCGTSGRKQAKAGPPARTASPLKATQLDANLARGIGGSAVQSGALVALGATCTPSLSGWAVGAPDRMELSGLRGAHAKPPRAIQHLLCDEIMAHPQC